MWRVAWTDVRFPAWISIPVRPWRQQILLYCVAGGSRVKRLWLWWLRWVGVGFQCLLGSVQTPHFTSIIDTWWMGALGNFNQFTMSPALDKNLAQECCLSLFRGANGSTCLPSCLPLSGCSNRAQHKMERACQRHHEWKERLTFEALTEHR